MSSRPMMRMLGSTSIRSDYDLMSGVYRALAEAGSIDFRLLVSGAHLSDSFGYTVKEIYRDGLPIQAEIETLLDSDTPSSRIKSASLLLQNSLHTIQDFRPDVLIIAGDREDALMVASIGAYLKIPTVHFFGGDHVADGNVDNPVRYAISKLVTAHFVAHEVDRDRLLRIGEAPCRIFVIGSPALDRFRTEPLMTQEELFSQIGATSFPQDREYAMMIHHPLLGQEALGAAEAEIILRVLLERGIPTFVNTPNTDAGSRNIMKTHEAFRGQSTLFFFKNLPRQLFVNLLRHAAFLIGNSSLGLLEAASIPLGVINVGLRQRGRLAPENVLFVDCEEFLLAKSIRQIHSPEFVQRLRAVRNPYGDGYSVERAMNLIRTVDFQSMLYKCEDPLEIVFP